MSRFIDKNGSFVYIFFFCLKDLLAGVFFLYFAEKIGSIRADYEQHNTEDKGTAKA